MQLDHADGRIHVEELSDGRRRIRVFPSGAGAAPPRHSWETAYPADLIKKVIDVKGANHVCDEIQRDEDPSYVQRTLRHTLLTYSDESAFFGKRLLDLGSGCGSSTLILARMLPGTQTVGVELEAEFLELARARADFYGAANLSFIHSPEGDTLPDELGSFDFIILSAVWEHVLPTERRTLLPEIWSHLNPQGVLFVNQLPHRYSPVERHTTGVPLLNYLPDRAVHWIAPRLSKRVERQATWDDLLRAGVRGSTPTEILQILDGCGARATLLEPSRLGMSDRIDLWHALSSGRRFRGLKRAMRGALKALQAGSGVTFVPDLSLAIRKESD